MMNKFTNDLQQFTFDQLADRVAMKVDYLSHIYNYDTIWKDILESCQMVEKEPRNISSVIVKAKKENTIVISGSSIKKYHTILTRIYILLYYCHYDENDFKTSVFPQLVMNMGIYAGDNILKNKIQKEIDEIISQDEVIEKALEEKKREAQNPKFSLPKLTQPESDELFDNYNDEKLFREFIEFYEEALQPNDIILDHARLWYVAKDIVKKLWVVNHPESYIERILRQFAQEKNSIGSAEPQYIMMCVYAIMRSIKGNHFEMATKRIENLADPNKEYYYLQDHMNNVKRWIQETNPFDDYDYIGQNKIKEMLYSKADFDQFRKEIVEDANKKIQLISEEKDKLQDVVNKLVEENERLNKGFNNVQKELLGELDEDTLSPEEKLGIDERIIFFCSALRLDITNSDANQTQLANLICRQTGDKPRSVRIRINKIANMQKSGEFAEKVIEAANNVITYLTNCCKKNVTDEKANLNGTIESIIEDIETVFKLSTVKES